MMPLSPTTPLPSRRWTLPTNSGSKASLTELAPLSRACLLSSLELLSTDAQELKDAYIAQSAFYSMLREGIVNATDPELSAWDWTKMLAIQPAMAPFELLEKYFNILPRPLAAWV